MVQGTGYPAQNLQPNYPVGYPQNQAAMINMQ